MASLPEQMTLADLETWLADPTKVVLLDAVRFIGEVSAGPCHCPDSKEVTALEKEVGTHLYCATCRASIWLGDHGIDTRRG